MFPDSLIPIFAALSLQEKRFLGYCIAHLNPKEETEFGMIKVRIGDTAKLFGADDGNAYRVMTAAADKANSKPVFRDEGEIHMRDYWFYHLDYWPGTGDTQIQFSERLVPLLLDLRGGFIQHRLAMSKDFSRYGWGPYVILRQWLRVEEKIRDRCAPGTTGTKKQIFALR